jgi:diadenosine tetraphosphate (Ap4A) HIT family hydrolase
MTSDLVAHGEKLTDVDDEYLSDTLIVSKRIAKALGETLGTGVENLNYNVLQVNLSS